MERRGAKDKKLYDSNLIELAAFQGSFETIKWLRSQGISLVEACCAVAAINAGRVEVLEYLREEGCLWCKKVDLGFAALERGRLEVLKWLKREGCEFGSGAHNVTAEWGRIEILEWLRSEGYRFDESTCTAAACEGELETLKWLRNLDPPCLWNKSVCRNIAERYDHPLVVRWIDEQL